MIATNSNRNLRTKLTNYIYMLVMSVCCWCIMALGERTPLPDHALYLSMTEIELTPGANGRVQIKVFSDDLQNALRNYSETYRAADLHQYFEKNRALAEQYFQAHFRLSINEKKVSIQLEDFQIENDAHFITFHFSPPTNIQQISLEADFFMELFPTQTNVVKVSKSGEPYFFKFTKPTRPEVLTWTR